MRNLVLPLLLLTPLAAFGQSLVTVRPQQCVWRAGDDMRWAAPSLDESGWKPYAEWTLLPEEPHIWVRCRANLSALRGAAHPTIQVTLPVAYQLYLNGEAIGGAGNVQSGNFSMNSIRSFSLPESVLVSNPATLATRITNRFSRSNLGLLSLYVMPLEIRAGDEQMLDGLRARTVLARVPRPLTYLVCYGIIGVLGFVLFALFLYDRSRRELLLLGIVCVCLTLIYASTFCDAAMVDYSASAAIAAYCFGSFAVNFARTWFFFALARRRVPLLFWIVLGLQSLAYVALEFGLLLPAGQSLWFAAVSAEWVFPITYCALLVGTVAPFVAFWPYTRIARRTRPLAVLCMAWNAIMLVFFSTGAILSRPAGLPSFSQKWNSAAADAQSFVTACVIVALLGLLFREQRQVTQERAELAGEMASAREIQQYLIPEKLPPTPGLVIQSVYHPSREVGGDFFQVLPDARDGSTLIVVGDVAGKGLKAGMLAALIVGAIRTAFKFTSESGEILALLNERLQGRGLVTCLALRIQRDGSAELSNAGHLPPYINGKELPVEAALPLGAVPGIAFHTMRFQLAEGEAMLLLSDGVVEARNAAGELFGFDRTRDLSMQSAETIAAAAQQFGQEDDITVLTLSFAPVAVFQA